MMRQSGIIAGLLLAVGGCAQPAERTVSVCETDPASGGLIALRMRYEDHVDTVVCQQPWSVWIQWNDTGRCFRLYDRSRLSVTETADFEVFLSCLDELPRGVQVERLDTCSASLAYEMPDEAWRRLKAVMSSGSRTWARDELSEQDRRILCTCECLGFEFPHR
ncbi:MAG: hypothetical protein IT452_11220 [Planctomycetia bacterium]|nr:hypothetical protein [Planctomycetia bacterium]